MKIAIVAEKFIAARSFAQALLPPGYSSTPRFFSGVIHGDEVVITWTDGHAFSQVEPHVYDPKWERWDMALLPVAPPEFDFILEPKSHETVERLADALDNSSVIVNACDAGREGELIFEEVLRYFGVPTTGVPSLRRLWITDTTKEGIRKSWANLRPHGEKALRILREQGRARAEADWLWGINLTRYATLCLRGKAGLSVSHVSMGRVRSPLQAIIADRCKEIGEHEPEPFFRGHLVFINEDGVRCNAMLMAPPAEKFGAHDSDWRSHVELQRRVNHVRLAITQDWEIIEGEQKEAFEYPPPPFDLVELQRSANRLLKWSAKRTEQVAQALYAKYHAISYPRTDECYLPPEMEGEARSRWEDLWNGWLQARFPGALDELPEWEPDFGNLMSERIGDHHGIIPTGLVPPMTVHGKPHQVLDEYLLWELIVLRFLGAWLPAAVVKPSSRVFTLPFEAGEVLRGLITAAPVTEPGWLVFEQATKTTRGNAPTLASRLETKLLPEMGLTARLKYIEVQKLHTTPPEYFTYDMLLYQMRRHGIGTAATQGDTIEELIRLGYITENSTKHLIISDMGELIVTLVRIHQGEEALSPKLSKFWEQQLDKVGKGGERGRDRLSILADILQQVKQLGLQMAAPANLDDVVFCPKSGLLVQPTPAGWLFPGYWKIKGEEKLVCPAIFMGRTMRASEWRDVLGGNRAGAGPYEFFSTRTNATYKAWIVFEPKEGRFRLVFKKRH